MSHADDGTLHAYLDGQLSPVELAQLEAHLASCPACRGRLEEERALVERADALLAAAAPPERALPPFPAVRRRSPLRRFRLPLTWAATVLLAVGAGWYLGAGSHRGAGLAPNAGLIASRVDTPLGYAFSEQQRQTPVTPPVRRDADRPAAREALRRPAAESGAASAGDAQQGAAPLAAAPSVVTSGPPAELKSADAPVPAASNVVVVDRASGRVPVVVTTSWQIIGLDAARPTLGANAVTIPGVPVRDVRRSPLGDGVVVVEQALDSTTVIQLFQRRADQGTINGEFVTTGAAAASRQRAAAPAPASAARDAAKVTERLARYVGSLRVEIAGPLTPDSLSKLLDLVR